MYDWWIEEDTIFVVQQIKDVLPFSLLKGEKKDEGLSYYQQIYSDQAVGILKIPSISLFTILMKAGDNEYYLDHLPDGTYHVAGSVFVDYRTSFHTDRKVIIYGHSASNYDIPFRHLEQYLKQDFFKMNKEILIITEKGEERYDIFSVYRSNDDSHMKVSFVDEAEWQGHITELLDRSIYESGLSFGDITNIITLQTCLKQEDGYLIIHARKK